MLQCKFLKDTEWCTVHSKWESVPSKGELLVMIQKLQERVEELERKNN